MHTTVHNLLRKQYATCSALDNNQKGHPMKHQRYGPCNMFAKVTARIICNCVVCSTDIDGHVILTYVDQSLESPLGMYPFEDLVQSSTLLPDKVQYLLNDAYYSFYR